MKRNKSLICDTFDEAFKLALAINDLELKILCLLCKDKMNITEISKKTKKSKIRIYQALTKLLIRNLIKREKKNLKKGYEYIYSCSDMNKIKEIAIKNVENLLNLLKKDKQNFFS
ncbi:MAG: helix-turn-helix domain-containing protein [Candidatus Anstonellales archaeon]